MFRHAFRKRWKDVRPAEVADRLDELQIVDVRSPREFSGDLGHLPGARLVPLDQLPRRLGELDPDTPTLVVCRSGGRSARAASMLGSAGFRELYNLEGGMLAWSAEGRPVER